MFSFTNQNPSPNYFSLPGIPLFYLLSIALSHQGQGREKNKKADNNSNQTMQALWFRQFNHHINLWTIHFLYYNFKMSLLRLRETLLAQNPTAINWRNKNSNENYCDPRH